MLFKKNRCGKKQENPEREVEKSKRKTFYILSWRVHFKSNAWLHTLCIDKRQHNTTAHEKYQQSEII